MASYDSTTGIHTMTIDEAPTYLKSLPQNTQKTPYKVKITNMDLNGYPHRQMIHDIMGWSSDYYFTCPKRYLDLSNTTFEVPHNIHPHILQGLFTHCEFLVVAPIISMSLRSMYRAFAGCVSLTTPPSIPSSVTDMTETFVDCTSLTTVPNIPSSVTDLSRAFAGCVSLTTPPSIPSGVTDMSGAFAGCTSLTTVPNIPSSVTKMYMTFYNCTSLTTINVGEWLADFSKIDVQQCFYQCSNLKKFMYNIKYKDNNNWILYFLKRTDNNLNIKKYSVETNTLIDDHIISLDSNTPYRVDLLAKSDELLIDRIGDITDQQISLLLESRMEFGDKYSLDPRKKWLVIWAENSDNVRSNCFVTQKELQKLKEKLKTYHPDLF